MVKVVKDAEEVKMLSEVRMLSILMEVRMLRELHMCYLTALKGSTNLLFPQVCSVLST